MIEHVEAFSTWLARSPEQAHLGALLDSPLTRRAISSLVAAAHHWSPEDLDTAGTRVEVHSPHNARAFTYVAEEVPHWPTGEPSISWRNIDTESFLPPVSIESALRQGRLAFAPPPPPEVQEDEEGPEE